MKTRKRRLDILLVERKIAKNLSEAQSFIMSGKIYTDNKILDKIGVLVDPIINLNLKNAKEHNWVSRGGIKLEHALNIFSISPENLTCLDVGCSTGGFSDVLLTYGAKKIYAVDVGYGEFSWSLRNNPKIKLFERTNARFLTNELIDENIDLLVCDVSFVGLRSILSVPLSFTSLGSKIIALIKPQFEVAKSKIPPKAIITDSNLHNEVIENIKSWFELQNLNIIDVIESPIKGMKGNTEFLIGAIRG